MGGKGAFEQQTGDFAAGQEDVIGPFDLWAQRGKGDFDSLADGESGEVRQARPFMGGGGWPEED